MPHCPSRIDNPISTHAPRTGSDSDTRWNTLPAYRFQPTLPARGATITETGAKYNSYISTHAPRTGSDAVNFDGSMGITPFQPTLPARGATRADFFQCRRSSNFNPRSPHGERPSPSAELESGCTHFNPRSPHGERQNDDFLCPPSELISTHAPRTGSDRFHGGQDCAECHFNPRSPHGERQVGLQSVRSWAGNFNPRSPHGERRYPHWYKPFRLPISTHAPRTGSDRTSTSW